MDRMQRAIPWRQNSFPALSTGSTKWPLFTQCWKSLPVLNTSFSPLSSARFKRPDDTEYHHLLLTCCAHDTEVCQQPSLKLWFPVCDLNFTFLIFTINYISKNKLPKVGFNVIRFQKGLLSTEHFKRHKIILRFLIILLYLY
jgi:hypothetical protein